MKLSFETVKKIWEPTPVRGKDSTAGKLNAGIGLQIFKRKALLHSPSFVEPEITQREVRSGDIPSEIFLKKDVEIAEREIKKTMGERRGNTLVEPKKASLAELYQGCNPNIISPEEVEVSDLKLIKAYYSLITEKEENEFIAFLPQEIQPIFKEKERDISFHEDTYYYRAKPENAAKAQPLWVKIRDNNRYSLETIGDKDVNQIIETINNVQSGFVREIASSYLYGKVCSIEQYGKILSAANEVYRKLDAAITPPKTVEIFTESQIRKFEEYRNKYPELFDRWFENWEAKPLVFKTGRVPFLWELEEILEDKVDPKEQPELKNMMENFINRSVKQFVIKYKKSWELPIFYEHDPRYGNVYSYSGTNDYSTEKLPLIKKLMLIFGLTREQAFHSLISKNIIDLGSGGGDLLLRYHNDADQYIGMNLTFTAVEMHPDEYNVLMDKKFLKTSFRDAQLLNYYLDELCEAKETEYCSFPAVKENRFDIVLSNSFIEDYGYHDEVLLWQINCILPKGGLFIPGRSADPPEFSSPDHHQYLCGLMEKCGFKRVYDPQKTVVIFEKINDLPPFSVDMEMPKW